MVSSKHGYHGHLRAMASAFGVNVPYHMHKANGSYLARFLIGPLELFGT